MRHDQVDDGDPEAEALDEAEAHRGQGPVEVQVSAQKIRFEFGHASLTSKVIDGAFPDYLRVIPRGNDKILRVNKKEFAEAVGRVAAISSERSRPVKLSLDRNHLLLSASSAEQGQAQEELEGDDVAVIPAESWRVVEPRATEVGGRDQPVVPTPDDDDVVGHSAHVTRSSANFSTSAGSW